MYYLKDEQMAELGAKIRKAVENKKTRLSNLKDPKTYNVVMFAEELKLSRQTVYDIFKYGTNNIDLLLKIDDVLESDILDYVLESLNYKPKNTNGRTLGFCTNADFLNIACSHDSNVVEFDYFRLLAAVSILKRNKRKDSED